MIEFYNITKAYKGTEEHALYDVSFHIKKGEFVFLIGETGAGKTTATRLMLKEELSDSGDIFVNGTDVNMLKRKELPFFRRKIGTVFQDFRLLPYKTVFQNVAFAMEITGTPKRNIEHMVPQILELAGLSHKANSMPSQLSGGEQQRTALARAMANNPPILIADEPTGNLDPAASAEVMDILERFNRRGTTVLVATHAKEIVDRMQKRVIELNRGRIVRDEKQGVYAND